MKAFFKILLLSLLFVGCTNKNECTVTANIKGIKGAKATVKYLVDNAKFDSVIIKGEEFSFTSTITEPQLLFILVDLPVNPAKPSQGDGMAKTIRVFAEPGKKITINGDIDSLEKLVFKGGELNNEFNKFLTVTLKPMQDKEKSFMDMSELILNNNPKAIDSLTLVYNRIQKEKKDLINAYCTTNKNSTVAATLSLLLYGNIEVDEDLKKVYNGFSETVKKTFAAKKLGEKIDAQQKQQALNDAKGLKIGTKVPEFSLKNADGKLVSLSSALKGKKLVLIDFWASWCGPCRKENPNVVAAYRAFKNNGFDILGVSLDDDLNEWKNAIKTDNLTWQQLVDALGLNESKVVATYGISAIPANFLVDENGVLVAQDLRGQELFNAIKTYLKL